MSIASSIYADHAEQKRLEWLAKLEAAIAAKDWKLADELKEAMKAFYFSE